MVADGMIGGRHRSNMELVAQGVANIASPLFGGIPATGAIARTATNVKNGGRTPIAGIIHAVTLLLIALVFGKWASLIPMATLAGILMLVAYQMSEWRVFRAELRGPREDAAVLVTTFLLTVLVDLTVAIAVGMVLAAFLFMKRMAEATNMSAVTRELKADGDDTTYSEPGAISRRSVPRSRRGLRDQRRVLLRRRRGLQGGTRSDRGEPVGDHHPHARREPARFLRAPRPSGSSPAVSTRSHARRCSPRCMPSRWR